MTRMKQRGVTSIFVVIFAALLFSVITLSFAGLMSRDQRRASDDELSRSAYDSALAGVEDAKRVIMAARNGNASARAALDAGECDTVQAAGLASGSEVLIQSSTAAGTGSALNQAYTCVKVTNNSPDYELSLDRSKSELVPLYATGSFDRIKLEWHKTSAAGLTAPCGAADMAASNPDMLCAEASWGPPVTTPALLRAQTITPGAGMTFAELNDASAGGTVFLYPGIGVNSVDFATQERFYDDYAASAGASFINRPRGAVCEVVPVDSYACSMVLKLDSAVPAENKLSLLRLTALYNATDVRVTLYSDSTPVDFSGVQPVVDSTGRANDLFRRVEARLSLSSDVTLPEAALDVGGPICKDFYVTTGGNGPINAAIDCQP